VRFHSLLREQTDIWALAGASDARQEYQKSGAGEEGRPAPPITQFKDANTELYNNWLEAICAKVMEGNVVNKTVLSSDVTAECAVDPVLKPGDEVVDDICNLNWSGLSLDDLIDVAWSYYYFSIQFRENLEVARELFPDDEQLRELDRGERDTDNLSPYPGVVAPGERVNHDEFMRRTLQLTAINDIRRHRLEAIGEDYLSKVRAADNLTKATSLSSYEDGGLERVFGSMLKAQHWDDSLLRAFKHFLERHIELDSDVESGHGGLCRHLMPIEPVRDLWTAFRDSLVRAAPALDDALQCER
jgi:hypothetical protein